MKHVGEIVDGQMINWDRTLKIGFATVTTREGNKTIDINVMIHWSQIKKSDLEMITSGEYVLVTFTMGYNNSKGYFGTNCSLKSFDMIFEEEEKCHNDVDTADNTELSLDSSLEGCTDVQEVTEEVKKPERYNKEMIKSSDCSNDGNDDQCDVQDTSNGNITCNESDIFDDDYIISSSTTDLDNNCFASSCDGEDYSNTHIASTSADDNHIEEVTNDNANSKPVDVDNSDSNIDHSKNIIRNTSSASISVSVSRTSAKLNTNTSVSCMCSPMKKAPSKVSFGRNTDIQGKKPIKPSNSSNSLAQLVNTNDNHNSPKSIKPSRSCNSLPQIANITNDTNNTNTKTLKASGSNNSLPQIVNASSNPVPCR